MNLDTNKSLREIKPMCLKFLASLIFMAFAAETMAQNENDKRIELGKQVFTALQTSDGQLYRNLYPTFEEYKGLMQQMVNAKVDGLTQEQMNGFLEDYKRQADSMYHAEFVMLQKQADSLGINWKEAKFVSFESIAAFPENISIKYLDGYLKFDFAQTVYIMDVEGFEFSPSFKLQAVKDIRKDE